jgi:MFS family permease
MAFFSQHFFNQAALPQMFRSLRYRNYRLFFAGQSVSLIGTWIQRIAMPWLVYHLTGSVVLLGVVGFTGQIPTLILSPFAGVLADRWNRYQMLIVTQVLAMLQALALAYLYYAGIMEVWHLIVLSIVLGCINAFDVPARQSLVVEMVERKEDIGNAIALNSTMFNTARLIGPSTAGLLIAYTGEGVCFLINGISYFFVIGTLLKMKLNLRPLPTSTKNIFVEMREGFMYTFGLKPIKYLILLLALISLMGMPYSVLLPVFAKEFLHGDSHTYGFLMGASGLGALIGATYLANLKKTSHFQYIVPLSTLAFALSLIAFSISTLTWLSTGLLIITGLGMMLQTASTNTIIQTMVDDDKRGRVLSFYTMAAMGITPFGSLLAGASASYMGPSLTLFIGSLICAMGALWFIYKQPLMKKEMNLLKEPTLTRDPNE